MASSHIHSHVQSILVPKGKFKNEQEARKHVQDLGFKTNVKPVHITDNYYRYRQEMPNPNDHYKTGNIDGVKAIFTQKTGIIDHNHNLTIKDPALQQDSKHKKQSLYNHQPIVGANGHGIWKPEYQNPILGQGGHGQRQLPPYMTAQFKSALTPAQPVKPWQVQGDGSSQMQMTQSYYGLKGSKKQKYF